MSGQTRPCHLHIKFLECVKMCPRDACVDVVIPTTRIIIRYLRDLLPAQGGNDVQPATCGTADEEDWS